MTKISSKTMLLQTHSQSDSYSLEFPVKQWCCKLIHNQKHLLIFTGTCFCIFTFVGRPAGFQVYRWPVQDRIQWWKHSCQIHMFCGGFSKSEPAHWKHSCQTHSHILWWIFTIRASTLDVRSGNHSHSDSKAPHVNEPSWPRGLQILWNGHLFFGDGFFSGFDWSFQVEHFERADDTVLRLMNSKPRRKAKKPALKRPAKASRKQPAVASPQIPEP